MAKAEGDDYRFSKRVKRNPDGSYPTYPPVQVPGKYRGVFREGEGLPNGRRRRRAFGSKRR